MRRLNRLFLKVYIFGLFLGVLMSANGSSMDFTIAAVGAFGEPLASCRVDSFRLSSAAPGVRTEYKDSFHGLVASDLPDGDYEAILQCREARIKSHVGVSEPNRFRIVRQNGRVMRSDHLVPQLVIRVDGPRPLAGTWWVTLRAVFDESSYVAEFQNETGEAQVADPDPGTYLVSVLSATGSDCLREIDLVEATRLWTVDPISCRFHLDAFAHAVTEEDKREFKTTSWYRALRRRNNELFRALDDASKVPADHRLR